MSERVPGQLLKYVPKGHALAFYPKHDPEADKPKALRNVNAVGGLNRRDWIVCVCGNGLRVDGPPALETWLEAVNQCRLATHSPKTPCLPVTLEGMELPIKEAPDVKKTLVHA